MAAAFPALAGEAAGPAFVLPLRCEIGRDCFIQNYVDHDPGPGYRDYQCGSLSSDEHAGTDFRVKPGVANGNSLPVVAAAAGRVAAVRDGVPDRRFKKSDKAAVKGQELGNAVVIDHGNGWRTYYGHMRKGSLKVETGDNVVAGQLLGLTGLSGMTEFPHLHFEVRRSGRVVDPFVGPGPPTRCGPGDGNLWSAGTVDLLAYVSTGVVDSGFTGEKPSPEKLDSGSQDFPVPTPRSPALVFWVELYGAREADVVTLRLVRPDGKVIAEEQFRVPKNKAKWFGFVGKASRGRSWAPGEYRGECELLRQAGKTEQAVVSLKREMRIPSVDLLRPHGT